MNNIATFTPGSQQPLPNLLFVDDEQMMLHTMRALFRNGYALHTADGAQQALDILGKEPIDVVVSDERMPGMTGVELLHEAAQIAPSAVRIMLTGYADNNAVENAINAGEVYRFITKPWDNRYLRETVKDATAHAKSLKESGATEPDEIAPIHHSVGRPTEKPAPTKVSGSFLVIDDRADISSMVGALYDPAQVVHARTLSAAEQLLHSKRFEVVVAETRVNGKASAALLQKLKQNRPATMSIVVSEQNDFTTLQQLINKARVFRYFRKPVKQGMLKLALNSALLNSKRVKNSAALTAFHGIDGYTY